MEISNKNQIMKFISRDEIADITDKLIDKYELEKEIEEEEEVKAELKGIEDPRERRSIKFFFSELITKQIEEGKNFDEIYAFGILYKIINEFIDKKISFKDLSLTIEKRLGLSSKKSGELAEDIKDYFPSSVQKEIFTTEEDFPEKKKETMEIKENIEKEEITKKKEFIEKEEVKKDNFREKNVPLMKKDEKVEDSYREQI